MPTCTGRVGAKRACVEHKREELHDRLDHGDREQQAPAVEGEAARSRRQLLRHAAGWAGLRGCRMGTAYETVVLMSNWKVTSCQTKLKMDWPIDIAPVS